MTDEIRIFESGATRDIATGKLEYSDYINPLCDYSFADYMKGKQYIGGGYRPGDNRQKGMPPKELLASLTRHMEIVKLLTKGHIVFEVRLDGIINLIVDMEPSEHYDYVEQKTMLNELNAIRFNSEALKLYYLTN